MAKSPLLRRASAPNAQGRVHHVTPKSAGWTYVGFEVFHLKKGEILAKSSGNNEICAVLLSGKALASVVQGGKSHSFGEIGERKNEFEGSPWSLYAPSHAKWSLQATTDVEVAVCAAPATGKLPPRVIKPEECGQETRGKGSVDYVNVFKELSGYTGWVVLEAEQDPKKASPLENAIEGVANLKRFLAEAGLK